MGLDIFKSKQTQSASWGNRHCKSSAEGGRPDNAVGFLCEGNFAVGKNKDERFVDPYEAQALNGLDIDETLWKKIQFRLQESWGCIKKGQFKDEIKKMNEEIFHPRNLHAVYAEYGAKGGQ